MCASKAYGPLCSESNPTDIDNGTMCRNASPRPGPTCNSIRPDTNRTFRWDTLIFDQDQVIQFLASVAKAKIAEKNVKVVWKEYDESTFLNVVYTLMPWKGKPGWAEIESGDTNQITVETDNELNKLLETFLKKSAMSPQSVVNWLSAQEAIRSSCFETIKAAHNDVIQINQEVQHETQIGIARLATIKAGSTIALKTLSLFVGGWPSFLIGLGYDVSLDQIQDWDKAGGAKVVGVATKTSEKFAKKVVKDAAKNAAEAYQQDATLHARKAEWLSKRLEKMDEALEKQTNAQKLRKFAKDSRKLARAQAAAGTAGNISKALSTVKYVFYAYDVFKAGKTASSDFEAAGYQSSWEAIKDMF